MRPVHPKMRTWAALVLLASSLFAAGPAAAQDGPVRLLRVPNRGLQPQAAVDSKGILHLIYFRGDAGHGDLFYVRSTDEGTTFSRPVRVNSEQGSVIAIGNIRGAQLALGKNDRLHVAWNASRRKGPDNEGMLYSRLRDDGASFEPQRNVMGAAEGLDGGGSVAADPAGNVYVVWHAPVPGQKGEAGRRVWVAHSKDEGRTFVHEKAAFDRPTGACGCCGLRAFADRKGALHVLYRSATQQVHRDTYLLISRDQGASFQGLNLHPWRIDACPMSSFAFAEGSTDILAAWETAGQVYLARVGPDAGTRSEPRAAPGESRARKHPVVACDAEGRTILAWTEGMSWSRGGAVGWQALDRDGKPTSARGRADGVPAWSLVAVFARKSGGFTILY